MIVKFLLIGKEMLEENKIAADVSVLDVVGPRSFTAAFHVLLGLPGLPMPRVHHRVWLAVNLIGIDAKLRVSTLLINWEN